MDAYRDGPQWGWCQAEGCKEAAFPIWYSGDDSGDPDLLLCEKHTGELIRDLRHVCIALIGEVEVWAAMFGKAGTVPKKRVEIIIADSRAVIERAGGNPWGIFILPEQRSGEWHTGSFSVYVDEDGRYYWYGGEDGWKDKTEIGEDGVLAIDARHFAPGTVLTLSEPMRRDSSTD